ncbi:hypothetical protein BH11ACT6_BH11ACT6_51250 [soil metagenome]
MVTVVDVDAGPRTVARRVEVSAPAAEVFALLANPRNLHELDGSGALRDVPVLGPERLTIGDTFTVGVQQSGIPYQATSTVTAMEDDKSIEWADDYGRKWRWDLTQTADGTTEVTESLDSSSAVVPLFDQMSGVEQHGDAITMSLRKLAEHFTPATVRAKICYSRWNSPNLRAAS